MNDDALEPEVLSYRAFQDREILLAWEQRRRSYELTGVAEAAEDSRVAPALGWIRDVVGRLSEGVARHS